jgi:hypothetical protein
MTTFQENALFAAWFIKTKSNTQAIWTNTRHVTGNVAQGTPA